MGDTERKTFLRVILVLIVLLFGSVILNVTQYHDLNNAESKTEVVEKHDTLTIRDTITMVSPKPAEIIKTTEYIKVPIEIVETDTVFAELPKTEKVYRDDSTYECQISGVEPNLDYIKVFPKTTIITNEKVITTVKTRKTHFNWGIQSGMGYGVFNKKLDLYIGLGAQYSF